MHGKLIHVTDPHLMPPGRTLCALDPAVRLRAVVEEVNRLHSDADGLILTGDLSYHGLEPAYRVALEILADLRIPYHLLIGNHDDREAFKRIFSNAPTDDSGFVQYVVELGIGSLIVLDTVCNGYEEGEVCDARLNWLEDRLAERPDSPVFIFMHHPPFDIGIESIDTSKVPQGAALATLLKDHGNVRHIFYGHVHRAISGSWYGIPATTLPGTNHQVALLLDPSNEMIGTHERPAYGVVLIDEESVVIHQKDFVDDSPRFVLTDPRSKDAASPGELVSIPEELVGRA